MTKKSPSKDRAAIAIVLLHAAFGFFVFNEPGWSPRAQNEVVAALEFRVLRAAEDLQPSIDLADVEAAVDTEREGSLGYRRLRQIVEATRMKVPQRDTYRLVVLNSAVQHLSEARYGERRSLALLLLFFGIVVAAARSVSYVGANLLGAVLFLDAVYLASLAVAYGGAMLWSGAAVALTATLPTVFYRRLLQDTKTWLDIVIRQKSSTPTRTFDDRASALGEGAAQAGQQLEARAALASEVAAELLRRSRSIGWIAVAIGTSAIVGGSGGVALFISTYSSQALEAGAAPSPWLALGISSMAALAIGLCIGLLRHSAKIQEQYRLATRQADTYRNFLLALDLSNPNWAFDSPDQIRARIIGRLFDMDTTSSPDLGATRKSDDEIDLKGLSEVLKNAASAMDSAAKATK